MSKHILLVHDLAGYGKVSLSAMMPVLSHMGHHLYTLPTALVSNTLDYGKFYIQETTEYMRQSLKVWAELGFSFDVVSTGMILSAEQAALVSDFCEQSAKKGALVFVDPIMGDEGKLYNGVGEETVAHMRKMVAVADCIVPNYTEAAYLADMPYHEDMTEEEARALTIRLHEMGAKSVVVTSAKVDGENCVVGYDGTEGEFFRIPFDLIPVRFVGTGDIFAAVMLGWLVDGVPLQESTHRAMDAVRTLIDRKGSCPCHHGHKIGDSWDFDTERGQLCPMAMHVAFLYADILRYGGSIPGQPDGTAVFSCPDADTLNIFRVERIEE